MMLQIFGRIVQNAFIERVDGKVQSEYLDRIYEGPI
jgi:hypothetical protein